MSMPKLQPVPIKTKNHSVLRRIIIWMTSIRKWEVVEDWYYDLPDGPKVIVPKGFIFDGASIPRPLWFLLSPTGLLLIPGLIHDFAYRYDYLWAIESDENSDIGGNIYKYKENSGQWYWDGVFRDVGEDVNGMAVIDTLAWAVLFFFGWVSWRLNRNRNADEIKPSEH